MLAALKAAHAAIMALCRACVGRQRLGRWIGHRPDVKPMRPDGRGRLTLRLALDRLLPRSFRQHRLQLSVELTQAGAAGLDMTALPRLGHDRDRLLHGYFAQCLCLGDWDCPLLARTKRGWKPQVALGGTPLHPLFTWTRPNGQEHLFDRNVYAPGMFDLDAKGERALLALVHKSTNTPPHAATQARATR